MTINKTRINFIKNYVDDDLAIFNMKKKIDPFSFNKNLQYK